MTVKINNKEEKMQFELKPATVSGQVSEILYEIGIVI